MDYDDLVARLRGGCDANTAFLHCYEAADVITSLRERVGELARTLNDHLLSEAAETMRADKAQAELANLQVAFNDWKVFHSTASLEAELAAAKRWHEQSSEQWRVAVGEAVQRVERAEADLAAARALLNEQEPKTEESIYADWLREQDAQEARRYRWLRDESVGHPFWKLFDKGMTGAQMDAAIDAALKDAQ